MQKISAFENIEIPVNYQSSATRWYFPDQPQLRFVSLNMIVAYTQNNYGKSVISGLPVLSSVWDTFKNAALVLYYDDLESVSRMPLVEYQNDTASSPVMFLKNTFNGQRVIWTKSYVILSKPIDWTFLANNGITGDFCFPFGIYYS